MLTSDTAQLIQRRTSNRKALITDLWGFGVNTGWLWVKAGKRLLNNLRMALMPSAEAAISAPPLDTTPAENSIAIDEAFVVRLRGGDNDAWDEFVESYSPKLFAYLRYKLPTREDAEDVLNETFGAAVRAIHSFDGRASLLTWLAAIARNKVANYYKALPEPAEPEEMAQNMPAPILHFSLEFREALDVIPPHIRQVLLLRYRQGFNVSEVAELTGRSYKSAESLLSRGRALLAALLNKVEM